VTSLRVSTHLQADPATVWADLRHIERHAEWMHDAECVVFTSDHHEGLGTTFVCPTRVGPIRLKDRMEITSWIPQQEMGVRHVGLVTGHGKFTLLETGSNQTQFVWEETLRFPWWLAGRVGAHVGAMVLRQIWKRNLRLLAQRFAA